MEDEEVEEEEEERNWMGSAKWQLTVGVEG